MSSSDSSDDGRMYVESPIIMSTVRVVTPFVFTFGLFIMFHGADSSGGGFQGGVIISTVIIMLAIAFGIKPTMDWLDRKTIILVSGLGVVMFITIGFLTILFGGTFLEYSVINIEKASKYGVELVEVAIGIIVSSIVILLFFVLAEVRSDPEKKEKNIEDE